jgi:dolichol-phosphate mannosyltransferase
LLAILTALLIISGLQIIIFGIISDFTFRNNAQIRRELIALKSELKSLRDANAGRKVDTKKNRRAF